MTSGDEIKSVVKEKYGEIAKKSLAQLEQTTCCGTQCCDPHDFTPFNDDYTNLAGYNKEADLLLGCGVPTQIAEIEPGDTVLDLGSGAGNDAFVARALVGSSGRVIGVDMTEAMIEKARLNAEKLSADNVEFRLGDIEALPVEDNSVDVVISNCVLNLVPDKARAFSEMFRVMKSGGHFSVSDIVLSQELPEALRKDWEMYAGCVAGAILRDSYLEIISSAGFRNIEVRLEKPIALPRDVLLKYLSESEAIKFETSSPVSSITVYGEK